MRLKRETGNAIPNMRVKRVIAAKERIVVRFHPGVTPNPKAVSFCTLEMTNPKQAPVQKQPRWKESHRPG
jgi:hypothetical protein